jgi:AraC family transcriptional regulator
MAMSKGETPHATRLQRVVEHIHDHLDHPLDLFELAEIACLSAYHWHRVYSGFYGETVFETVQRLRLHRAATDLIRTEKSVEHLARAAGYGSVAAFSRAFRIAYGEPPIRFRLRGKAPLPSSINPDRSEMMPDVTIENSPALRVAGIAHAGDYQLISRAFQSLFTLLMAKAGPGPSARMVGIYFDDPKITPVADRRSLAGVVVDEAFSITAPMQEFSFAEGPMAVLRHKGAYAELPKSYDWLYGVWLPHSGREPADAPPFEVYLNSPMDTAAPDLLTDICVPLKIG